MAYTLKKISFYNYKIPLLVGGFVIATTFFFSPLLAGILGLAMMSACVCKFLIFSNKHSEKIPDKTDQEVPPVHVKNEKKKYIFVDFCFKTSQNKIQEKIIHQKAQETAPRQSQLEKKCHFGLACFANFAIAAVTQPEKIILFDYDPIVVEFNKMAIEVLKISHSSNEFKLLMVKKCQESALFEAYEFLPKLNEKGELLSVSPVSNLWQTPNPFENLKRILDLPESFLANEQHFAYIKKLAVEDNINVFWGNMLDSEAIHSTVEVLTQNNCYLDSLYVSNIYDWFPQKSDILDEHINTLCGKQKALLIQGTNEGITVSHHSNEKANEKDSEKPSLKRGLKL